MNLKTKFIANIAKLAVKTDLLANEFCPDQYVGIIKNFDIGLQDFPVRKPVAKRPNHKCLIMVLESPHTHEFSGLPGPAKGSTGWQIRDKLGTKILNNFRNHGLILMNAVPFQCSLGYKTKVYRDKVFKSSWAEFAKNDFEKRLKSIFKKGDSVICCCTIGNDKHNPLRDPVIKSIKKIMGRHRFLKSNHPFSWFAPVNRIVLEA